MPVATDLFERLAAAAVLAPSSHNTQPWRIAHGGDHVDVLADRLRALPVNDPYDRELVISCGCAVFNLEVAADSVGLAPRLQAFPDGPGSDLLARVLLVDACAEPGPHAPLERAIAARRTWRGAVEPTPPGPALQARLAEAAAHHGVRLSTLQGDARIDAAALVDEGDRTQWADPSWRRELALWMHPRRLGDGLTVPAAAAPVARALVRAADMGRSVGHRDREAVAEAPWLGVLTTVADRPADWLAAGRALQHLLLEAERDGFQAGYYNQPLQVAPLRPRLGALVDGVFPQVMFRLARPAGVAHAAPRRPLAEVMEHGAARH